MADILGDVIDCSCSDAAVDVDADADDAVERRGRLLLLLRFIQKIKKKLISNDRSEIQLFCRRPPPPMVVLLLLLPLLLTLLPTAPFYYNIDSVLVRFSTAYRERSRCSPESGRNVIVTWGGYDDGDKRTGHL